MKLPRAISAERLIRVLQTFGYVTIRQKGSHVRLKHDGPPAHSVTVPQHQALKTGTLHAILSEVAQQRSISMEEIVAKL